MEFVSLRRYSVALLAVLFLGSPARSELTIEISGGAEGGMPVAVVPFGWDGAGRPPQDLAEIIRADLARSGRIAPLAVESLPARPVREAEVVYDAFRKAHADAIVIGRLRPAAPAGYEVEFHLLDGLKETQLVAMKLSGSAERLRMMAHEIADVLYEKLTGDPGAFATRIAYVVRESGMKGRARLQVADSDGANPQTIALSDEPIMSPAWSPEGGRLAYVSFERGRSRVYVQRVADGHRQVVAEWKGLNSAPAWSPDGRKLAVVLSRDGNAEIYVIDLASQEPTRLTRDPAIDTEPVWSPDGRSIVFTSDRSGKPQLYRMREGGGPAERLSFEVDYAARGAFSPDASTLYFLGGSHGKFRVSALSIESRALRILSEGPMDEAPAVAPNGSMVLFATRDRGRGVLAVIPSDGRGRQILHTAQGDVRDPAWSPYNSRIRTP